MKNLKIIGFSLFVLACNAMMSIDDIEQPSTQEPIEKHIDVDFDEPIIDKKAKIKYTHTRYTVEPSPYAREEASEQNLAREEKLKKFRQQERATKKIQSKWRSYKEDKDFTQKIENFKRKRATTKLQRVTRDYLKEKRINKFTEFIKKSADQSYPKFKELICTSDYLTKTDWIYQFIEAAENKTIFERNSDGTINPNEFTPEFEKEISNPTDWLDNAITKYLPEFHKAIYETFIDKAVEQIIKHRRTWTDTVSIPTPKGHGSFQEEGTPLFPKIYTPSDSSYVHLVLGKIFMNIIETDPELLEKLFNPSFTPDTNPNNVPDEKWYTVTFLDQKFNIGIPQDSADELYSISKEINDSNMIPFIFNTYLNRLGLEYSPKEQQLKELYSDIYLMPPYPQQDEDDTDDMWIQKLQNYDTLLSNFDEKQEEFLTNHINWASSARQTFYLGQLLFDKDLTAFDALGGQEWFKKQPQDMQEYIANYIEKLKTAQKQYALKKHVATENNSTTNSLTAWNTRVHNAFKGGMRSMWSKKE